MPIGQSHDLDDQTSPAADTEQVLNKCLLIEFMFVEFKEMFKEQTAIDVFACLWEEGNICHLDP